MLMVFSFWEPFSIPISDNPLLTFPPNSATQIWPTILYQRSLFSNHNTKSFWKGYLNIYNNLKYFYIKTNTGKLKCEIQSGLIFVKRQETKEKELFQGKELNWKPSQQRYKSKQITHTYTHIHTHKIVGISQWMELCIRLQLSPEAPWLWLLAN